MHDSKSVGHKKEPVLTCDPCPVLLRHYQPPEFWGKHLAKQNYSFHRCHKPKHDLLEKTAGGLMMKFSDVKQTKIRRQTCLNRRPDQLLVQALFETPIRPRRSWRCGCSGWGASGVLFVPVVFVGCLCFDLWRAGFKNILAVKR